MILVLHIASALLSIGWVTYTAFSPTKHKLQLIYFLSGSTILSGVALVFMRPVYMGRACVSGIFFLGFMIAASTVVRKKLAAS